VVLKEAIPIYLGDVVRLRKPHPCGSYEWIVVRTGVDTGLRCMTCGRRVLIPRLTAEKRIKAFISRGPEAPESDLPRTPRELLGTGTTLLDSLG
jgi:hypothetical protein